LRERRTKDLAELHGRIAICLLDRINKINRILGWIAGWRMGQGLLPLVLMRWNEAVSAMFEEAPQF